MESANAGRLPLPAAQRSRRGSVVATMRPKQWIKNALIIAAAGAAGALGHDDTLGRVAIACVAFGLLASGIYAINDVRDAQEDRLHPRKRFRPVAARELDPRFATGLGLSLVLAGIVLCAAVGPLLALVGAGYVALTLSYTLLWRHLIVFDIVAVAGGFVLRAVAGGVAAPVTLSSWFLVVVTGSAVFVAAAKRHAELRRTDGQRDRRRRVLNSYSASALELIIAGASVVALSAYWVWAFSLPLVHGIPWRPLTMVPFAVCLLRYGELVQRGDGEAPEDVLLSDRPLQFAGFAWLAMFALEVHAAG
ncbi:MAG TPA: decaprenyl-phosphate phosphoribosyltransferase [Solirubrobacteraceae bacterium]|nr:decaprenyl-phosphate phosphoribosyltransferase [Solirubrobacteraceae bacterium]